MRAARPGAARVPPAACLPACGRARRARCAGDRHRSARPLAGRRRRSLCARGGASDDRRRARSGSCSAARRGSCGPAGRGASGGAPAAARAAARGAHPRPGVRQQAGGGQREEDPPLHADVGGDPVLGDPGLVEQPQHEQQRAPQARGEHHRPVAAGQMEAASLGARVQQVQHRQPRPAARRPPRTRRPGRRSGFGSTSGAARRRVDDRVLLVPRQEHRHEQRDRGDRRQAPVAIQGAPGVQRAALACAALRGRRRRDTGFARTPRLYGRSPGLTASAAPQCLRCLARLGRA